jgi:hypothetical protein
VKGADKSSVFVDVLSYLLGPNFAHLQSITELTDNLNKLLVLIECLGKGIHTTTKKLMKDNDQDNFLNFILVTSKKLFSNTGKQENTKIVETVSLPVVTISQTANCCLNCDF